MIGYSELLNARMNGFAPEQVLIQILEYKPQYWQKQDAEQSIENGWVVEVLILPNESVSTLDLFALKGLTAHIKGKNERRSHEIIKVCQRYAKRVIHCLDGHLIILRGSHADQA